LGFYFSKLISTNPNSYIRLVKQVNCTTLKFFPTHTEKERKTES